MGKIIIGMATAALWFALSQAANAERVCRQVCDNGACVSKCVDHPDAGVVVRDHDRLRDRDDRPGIGFRAPGVDIDVDH